MYHSKQLYISIRISQQRAASQSLLLTQAPSGGSRLGIAIAAARERGMLGGGHSDDEPDAAGAGSPNAMRGTGGYAGSEDLTPLQSPGGVKEDDMFANFV
jgi:hypothetical protein